MALAHNFQSCIEIYVRLGPVIGETVAEYTLDHEERTVEWLVPRQPSSGMTNHLQEKYNFSFTGILDTNAKQDVVFETVAQKVVMGALDGYNGTIFAYGQTGSGKTYTITGNAERYVDRGLIPRTLSLIFSELAKRIDHTYQVHFAYLEIYNEIGYDLLNPDHETKSLEDLPKVTMLEDGENCFHLRNLSQHLATNEEEALNLLFVGDTNRMISATPMNLASSRSHCIFTITIEARKVGHEMVRKSKLHLVDLAGSERVWKNGIDGQILKEAKYINLSLHFLEQVIIALQERSQGKPRHHIPYRNSLMTSVLRDSIGGNSLTVMVATVTIAQQQLEETISTCRFAQRVALVSNQVTLNEEIDQNLLIKRLKQEIREMKEELQLLRGDHERGPLTANELVNLRSEISCYVADSLSDAPLNCGGTMVQIRAAFQILKEMLNKNEDKDLKDGHVESHMEVVNVPMNTSNHISSKSLQETNNVLNYQLQQRENEINILVSFIKKREKGVVTAIASTQAPDMVCKTSLPVVENKVSPRVHVGEPQADLHSWNFPGCAQDSSLLTEGLKGCNHMPSDMINFQKDRRAAFEIFQRSYPRWDAIEENKKILKLKYAEAKLLGEQVNKARGIINQMKAEVEKYRVDRAIKNLTERVESPGCGHEDRENKLISIIETEKRTYKDNFSVLRDLKKEIEHLHLLLEQSQVRLRVDFDKWLERFANVSPSTALPPKIIENWVTLLGQQEIIDVEELSSRPSSPTLGQPCPSSLPSSSRPCMSLMPKCEEAPPIAQGNHGALHVSTRSPQCRTPTSTSMTYVSAANSKLENPTFNFIDDANLDGDVSAFYKAHAYVLSTQM